MKRYLVALAIAGCARPLLPSEQEIGDVAVAAEMQPCVSTLRISHRSGVRLGTFSERDHDGSVVRSHRTSYDIDACGVAFHLDTVCAERHGKMLCDLTIGDAAPVRRYEPPQRARLVAELIAVFDHAQSLFQCTPLFAGIFELERRADGARAYYSLAACGGRRTFRVACPDGGSVDAGDCNVVDLEAR